MTYAEEQTVTVGPWTITVSYKGDKFEDCSMSRSTAELVYPLFGLRMACYWFLIQKNGSWNVVKAITFAWSRAGDRSKRRR